MKFKLTRVALATMSLLPLLTACGENGDSGNPVVDNNTDNTSKVQSLEVRAIDGYLEGARVWLDVNGNYKLDEGEPSAITGADGVAKLDVSALGAKSSQYTLLVEAIAGQTIDSDTPESPITQGFVMSAPAGYTVITPLSTLVQQKIAGGASKSEAEDAVKSLLQQPDLNPASDYIAQRKSVAAGQAKAMTRLLPATAT